MKNFDEWYDTGYLELIVHSTQENSDVFRYITQLGGLAEKIKEKFFEEYIWLHHIGKSIEKAVCFIGSESHILQNHFVFIVICNDSMLIINPVGKTQHTDFSENVSSFRRFLGISNVYVSNLKLQKDEHEIVSCGPICLELMRHISCLKFKKILETFEILKEKKLENSDDIIYVSSSDIGGLLPDFLNSLSLSEGEAYRRKILNIREEHFNLYEKLDNIEKPEQALLVELVSSDSDADKTPLLTLKKRREEYANFWVKKNFLNLLAGEDEDAAIDLLKKHNFLMSVMNFKGLTPLLLAIQYDFKELAELLINMKASLDTGLTPFPSLQEYANSFNSDKKWFLELIKNSSKSDINQQSLNENSDLEIMDDVSNETDWAKINQKVLQKGYLTKVQFESNYKYKSLPKSFSWPDEEDVKVNNGKENYIPMLSVITGKNGIGKTALLEVISKSFETQIKNRKGYYIDPPTVILFGKEFTKLSRKAQPQVFGLNYDGNNIHGVSNNSVEAYEEDLKGQVEDLKMYHLSICYGIDCELKYPQNLELYKQVRKNCLNKLDTSIKDPDLHRIFDVSLANELENEIGLHLAKYASLNTYPKYLLERVTTVSELNNYLAREKFKYILSDKCFNNNKFDRLTLQKPGRRMGDFIDHDWLSPGEKLELLTLLWLFETKIVKENKNGAIFILDEFDAHLHPSLAKQVIEAIKRKLVGEYSVQVIMTTHNPTTVSLVPKDCLYIMSNENHEKKVKIKKAISKKQAIQLLTADFVCVNEPIRIVFVEADNDKKFYEIVQDNLIQIGFINPEYQLIFKSHGRRKIDSVDAEEKVEGAEKDIPEDSSRKQVEILVQKCVDGTDEDKTLRDFIFGLVDDDNRGKSDIISIKSLNRYAIENYLFDPIHIFFYLKQIKESSNPNSSKDFENTIASFTSLYEKIKKEIQALRTFLPKNLEELLNMKDLENKEKILKIIVTEFFSYFLSELLKISANPKNQNREDKKIIGRLKSSKFKLMKKDGELIKKFCEIKFMHDISLDYPEIFLRMRGHDIEYVYKKLFPILNISCMINFCKISMFIPLDLAEILKSLQNPVSQTQKVANKKKKNKDVKQESEQNTIEKLKVDIKNKDKKIQNQADKIRELENKTKKQRAEIIGKSLTAKDNLNQLLKCRGVFNSKPKSFEAEDICRQTQIECRS